MKQYAVIGNPVGHSLSPKIHQTFAKQTGVELSYQKITAPLDGFESVVKDFFAQGGSGCNVTVPFKEQAFTLADQLSDNARLAGAVNCLTLQSDGKLQGDNFDGVGLVQDLCHRCQYDIREKKVLIIGAGGAARGILAPLLEKVPQQVVIANRTPEKAQALAELFAEYDELAGVSLQEIPHDSFDLIIHATSLGYQGKRAAVPARIFQPDSFCYDLSYGEAARPFLDWVRGLGVNQSQDGIGMLIEQAAAAFYLWCGIYPDTDITLE